MGDPKRHRKKYVTPMHPYEAGRIVQEKEFMKVYGFKNKKELWKLSSKLKVYSDFAKKMISATSKQAEVERQQLLDKLVNLGLIAKTAGIDDILELKPENIFERRLQTLVFKKGLSKSINQARQFIVHGHIMVGGKVVTSPSSLITISLEPTITFKPSSALHDEMHPERVEPQPSKTKIELKPKAGKKEIKEDPKKERKKEAPKEEKPAKEKKEVPKE